MRTSELTKVDKIWMNGEFVDWEDAKIHVLSHALHYGSGVFEGIRCYETKRGSFILKLDDHMKRMYRSAKIYKLKIPHSIEEFKEAVKGTVRINKLKSCYIRPIVFYGYHHLGVDPADCPVTCAIAVWPWGTYLGEEGLEKGIRCMFTSWVKIHSRMVPASAKAVGQYINAMLAVMDARDKGFDEAIMLDENGNVSEGPGENIFIVKDGKVYTPGIDSSILPGITRDMAITLANDLGYETIEKVITKDELMSADEAFFSGTAAEITPITEIDNRMVGDGKRGTITREIQKKFFDVVKVEDDNYMEWLTAVY
jgi:branched-chain amino acid aminotransferase